MKQKPHYQYWINIHLATIVRFLFFKLQENTSSLEAALGFNSIRQMAQTC